jgi:hypothetical protein
LRVSIQAKSPIPLRRALKRVTPNGKRAVDVLHRAVAPVVVADEVAVVPRHVAAQVHLRAVALQHLAPQAAAKAAAIRAVAGEVGKDIGRNEIAPDESMRVTINPQPSRATPSFARESICPLSAASSKQASASSHSVCAVALPHSARVHAIAQSPHAC